MDKQITHTHLEGIYYKANETEAPSRALLAVCWQVLYFMKFA